MPDQHDRTSKVSGSRDTDGEVIAVLVQGKATSPEFRFRSERQAEGCASRSYVRSNLASPAESFQADFPPEVTLNWKRRGKSGARSPGGFYGWPGTGQRVSTSAGNGHMDKARLAR